MLTFTTKLPENEPINVTMTVALTAEERTKSRDRLSTIEGDRICFKLPRGTILKDGDLLQSETQDVVLRIMAKPEPVLTVTASHPLDLLKAAYHLGNRHVPLEINLDYLRLSADLVLQAMLEQLGLKVIIEEAPFQPEFGAYLHLH
ncbi:urease accessory protein UreE [Merismopedia glauca]|uniref:Urease accessory protein UreE n=1 Tax=Merismopedia glauca CCAP 1448/3 TaxID=1296344 RepID=A0A2T1C8P8_9CYAN|nr:urease accessory protein UreE [Merismopedia glauca]PSB04513.1 urease accessory protein UreE [Merismopedia glauca CCAP 1448/3]